MSGKWRALAPAALLLLLIPPVALAQSAPEVSVTGGAGLTAGESAGSFTADEGASVMLTASAVGIASPVWAWSQSEEDGVRVLEDGVATDSNELSLTLPAYEGYTLTLTVTATPSGGGESRSAQVLLEVSNTNGVCDRTEVVRNAIVEEISRVSDCGDVTPEDLAGITGTFDLSSEGITQLRSYDFAGLSSVTTLRLEKNSLSSLPADVFRGLSSLQTLRLYENRLSSLPADVFRGLSSLEDLRLYENSLSSLPPDVFQGLSSLESLRLYENSLSSLPADVFRGLSSLESLRLYENRLSSLPADVFQGLSSLSSLQLDENQLSSLPEGIFQGLSSLQTLRLNENSLSSLPAGIFQGLLSLQNLWLHENRLSSLPPGLFDGLTGVTNLQLRDNDLRSLSADTFRDMTSVLTLNLGDNDLRSLPADIFRGLTQLEILVLNRNELALLSPDLFDGLSRVYDLDLDNNRLSSLPAGLFDDMRALGWVSLQENRLTTLPPGMFSGLRLDILDTYSNRFQSLPEGLFTGIISFRDGPTTWEHHANPGVPHSFTVTLELAEDVRGVVVRVAQGVPRPTTFMLTAGGESHQVDIPLGGDRATHPIPAAAGTVVTLNAGELPRPWSSQMGVDWTYPSQMLTLPPDEGVRVSITAEEATVAEGSAATFTVTASEAPAVPLTVTVEVSGDAASEESRRRELVIESLATTATLDVTTAEVSGGAGAVTAAVRSGAGYETGDAPAATVAVTDTEADPNAIRVWFPEQSNSAVEGGTVTLTVNASATTTSGLAVQVDVSGAVAPDEERVRTVNFGADDRKQTFTVVVHDDTFLSGHHALVATVASSTGYEVGIPSSIVVTVFDDEKAPTGLSLSVLPEAVAEDAGATTVTMTARFEGGGPLATSTEVVVTLTDDMARAGVTTSPAGPYTITIAAEMREGTHTFTVTPTPDAGVYGGDGRLMLTGTHSSLPVEGATVFVRDSISGASMVSVTGDAGLTPTTDTSYEGTPFTADDGATVTLTASSSFTGGTPTWAWSQVHGDEVWLHTPELETGAAILSLSLPNYSAPYTVHFRATATHGADTPLARAFTRDVRIVVDASDADPTILSAFAEAGGATSSDLLAVATGTEVILRGSASDSDIDQRLTVGWSGSGPSEVTLTEIEAGSPEVVMFTAPTETGGDYTFTFWADDDGDGGDAPVTSEVVVRVLAVPSVSIRSLSESVMEGEEARFELTIVGIVETAFTVNVALTGGENFGATSSALVMVNAGDTMAGFGVATTDDGRQEDNATLRATVVAGDGYVPVMPDFAEMTITDNGMSPDVNLDDSVDANDALILYYAYSLRSSLGTGR